MVAGQCQTGFPSNANARRLTMAMQRTVQTVTQIAEAIWERANLYRGDAPRRRRLTMAMQRTVQPVTQIASAIWPPACPAADRRR